MRYRLQHNLTTFDCNVITPNCDWLIQRKFVMTVWCDRALSVPQNVTTPSGCRLLLLFANACDLFCQYMVDPKNTYSSIIHLEQFCKPFLSYFSISNRTLASFESLLDCFSQLQDVNLFPIKIQRKRAPDEMNLMSPVWSESDPI